jgi:hypothetical protein
MATGPGYFDTAGLWHPGESDVETLFTSHTDLMQDSAATQLRADRVRLAYLEARVEVDTGWVELSTGFGTGWSSVAGDGFRKLAVRKKGNRVRLLGIAYKSSWSAYDTVITLPAAYLATSASARAGTARIITTAAQFDLLTNGAIRVTPGGSAYIIFDTTWETD